MPATTKLASGSITLAAAAWDDATGFQQDAQLLISAPGGNSQSIITAVDQSAVAQVLFLDVQRTFSGNMGTAASPLKTGAKTRIQNSASGGIWWLQAANIAGTGAANTIARYIHSSTSTCNLLGGTVTQIDQSSGKVIVGASVVVTTVNHSGGEADYDFNATPITTLTISGGTVRLKRGVTTIINYGGRLVYDSIIACTTFSGGPTSRTDWRGGAITTANILGSFTVENLTDPTTFTTVNTWASASFNKNTQSGQVLTITTENPIAGGAATAALG